MTLLTRDRRIALQKAQLAIDVAEEKLMGLISMFVKPPDFVRGIQSNLVKAASDLQRFVEIAQMAESRDVTGDTRMDNLHDHLKTLGEGGTSYKYVEPHIDILECFPNPVKQEGYYKGYIEIVAPEFTSLCPKTGQPDFATIVVRYAPDRFCVESKSFKLYLGAFRQVGMFHEACVQKICEDLAGAMNPLWISVEGRFAPRGGIKFWPVATWDREGSLPTEHAQHPMTEIRNYFTIASGGSLPGDALSRRKAKPNHCLLSHEHEEHPHGNGWCDGRSL